MIRYELTGDLEIGLRFEQFPDALHDDLLVEISSLGREAFASVAVKLPRSAGRLADQERLRILDQEGRIAAIVDFEGSGDDAKKAGALEYGSKGKPVRVRAHERRQNHVFERRLAAPRQVLVEAYARTPNIEGRRFIRSTVDAMRESAIERIKAAISKSVDNFND